MSVPVVPAPISHAASDPRVLRQIIESAQEAFVSMDATGSIVDWNRQAEAMFGWTRDEVVGRSLAETIIPPRFREPHRAGLERYLTTGEGPVIGARLQLAALRRNGEEFPVEFTISAVDDGGTPRFSAFLQDVTARVRAEQALRAQADVSRVLAEAQGPDDALPQVLAAVATALGWRAATVWRPDAAERVLTCAAFWASGEADELRDITYQLEFPVGVGIPGQVWASRAPLWVPDLAAETTAPRAAVAAELGLHAILGFPVFDADRQVVAVMDLLNVRRLPPDPELLAAMETIGAQVGEFLRRQRTQVELQRRLEDLEQFAHIAAHDLGEPLRTMRAFADLLVRRYGDQLDPGAREYVDYIVSGADRMRRLLDGINDYAQAAEGETATVDCTVVVTRTIESLRSQIQARDAHVELGPLPTVQTDEIAFERVIQNLLQNALKFTPPDEPPRVRIEAVRGRGGWTFAVVDHGLGIPPEQRERAFTIFQRLHTGERYAGSGLGLAICRKLVEQQGGRIWADETPGGGTTFRFTLPDRSP